jgi:hypothetical protein
MRPIVVLPAFSNHSQSGRTTDKEIDMGAVPVIQRSSGEHQTALTSAVLPGTNIGPILTT